MTDPLYNSLGALPDIDGFRRISRLVNESVPQDNRPLWPMDLQETLSKFCAQDFVTVYEAWELYMAIAVRVRRWGESDTDRARILAIVDRVQSGEFSPRPEG